MATLQTKARKALTAEESKVWTAAWDRSLAKGEDHGYAAHVADIAVQRLRTRALRQAAKS